MDASEPLTLTVHFLDPYPAKAFLRALAADPVLKEPACDLHLHHMSVRLWSPPQPYPPRPPNVEIYRVTFLSPTAFMFHCLDVLYPSPARLLYSALKTYSELTGIDTSTVAGDVSKLAELAGFKAARFLVDIGEGRKVPAFTGTAKLAVYGSRDSGLVRAALETAARLGVGVSRAIGFGRIRIISGSIISKNIERTATSYGAAP